VGSQASVKAKLSAIFSGHTKSIEIIVSMPIFDQLKLA